MKVQDRPVEKANGSDELDELGSQRQRVKVQALNMRVLKVDIEGTSPYVSNRMGQTARAEMRSRIEGGSSATSKKRRSGRDFDRLYKESMHISDQGWLGIPATALRRAMVDACRLTEVKMTQAKLAIIVDPHGFADDGTALVKIEGNPEKFETCTVNKDGSPNIVARAMWKPPWAVRNLCIRFDRDMLTHHDVANLLERVGFQVGIGAGRNFSENSTGMGWGNFEPKFLFTDDGGLK